MPLDRFVDRRDAGRALAAELSGHRLDDPVVLGLPRGGVVVAAEVARVLDAELDIVVVRKVGHPRQPELGLGAVAEDGATVWDERALRAAGLTEVDLAPVVAAERSECRRRTRLYRAGHPAPQLAGRTLVVVDDGVATGVTALAALRLLRSRDPRRLVMAAPVAARDAARALAGVADEVVTVLLPARFGAVSQFYDRFDQTSDQEVVRLLAPTEAR